MTKVNISFETSRDRNRSMALVLNEEQWMLRDSARGLISDKAPVAHLRQLRDAKDATGFSRELWRAFAGKGVFGLLVPGEFAGAAGERDGLTLFLVDPKSKGIETERTAMVDSHNAARIEFSNVEVNADGVLGEVDHGGALLEGVLNIGRGAVASEMVGLSEEVFSRTVGYLKERKQFGKLIGEFQALQHRAAQLYIEIEITRAAVLKALQTLDGNFDNAGAAVAVAKARAGSTATLAVQEGVQMHGGMGMTDQFDIGFFMKRARVCQELFGDNNFHADQLARMKNY